MANRPVSGTRKVITREQRDTEADTVSDSQGRGDYPGPGQGKPKRDRSAAPQAPSKKKSKKAHGSSNFRGVRYVSIFASVFSRR